LGENLQRTLQRQHPGATPSAYSFSVNTLGQPLQRTASAYQHPGASPQRTAPASTPCGTAFSVRLQRIRTLGRISSVLTPRGTAFSARLQRFDTPKGISSVPIPCGTAFSTRKGNALGISTKANGRKSTKVKSSEDFHQGRSSKIHQGKILWGVPRQIIENSPR